MLSQPSDFICLVNVALCKLWDRAPNAYRPTPRSIDISIALLVFTAVVFRAEVAVLLAPVVLQALYCRYISLFRVIKVGLISTIWYNNELICRSVAISHNIREL